MHEHIEKDGEQANKTAIILAAIFECYCPSCDLQRYVIEDIMENLRAVCFYAAWFIIMFYFIITQSGLK